MKDFIEVTLKDDTKVMIAIRHIAYIEPLADGKTRITSDIKTSITETKVFLTKEAYNDFIKRLQV